jgi:hypothetical protein
MEESGGDSSNMARTLDPIEMPPADCANLPRRLLAPLSRLVMVWTTLDDGVDVVGCGSFYFFVV